MSQNFNEQNLAAIMRALPPECQPAELMALIQTILDVYGITHLDRASLGAELTLTLLARASQQKGMH